MVHYRYSEPIVVAGFDTKAVDTSSWDGSPSNWDTAEAYCRDCVLDWNPSGEKKTKDRCALPYRKPGSSAVNKNAVRTMATGRGISAVNAPAEVKKRGANWIISKWRGLFGQPAPESVYRIAGKKRPPDTKAKFYEDSGGIWFLGYYSNNFRDKEGEIISKEAHEEYAEWVTSKGVKPPIVLMHLPKYPGILLGLLHGALEKGYISSKQYNQYFKELYEPTAIAETAAVISVDGFNIVIGKVYEHKKETVQRMLDSDMQWSMSHGFLVPDQSGNIINKYRTFEFTILPDEMAANFMSPAMFTGVEMDEKKLTEAQREILDRVEPGLADRIEENMPKVREILEGVLDSKALEELDETVVEIEQIAAEDEEETPEETPTEETSVDETVAKVFEALQVPELQATLQKMADLINEQGTKINQLETEMKEFQKKTEDEIVAAQFDGPIWSKIFDVGGVSDEALADQLKDKVAEDQPVPSGDSPLEFGFWKQVLPTS